LEDQDLRGDERQRPEGPGLDRADRHAAAQVPSAAVPVRVVALEPGRPAADESLHAPRPLGVAGSAVCRPADDPHHHPGGVGPWLIGTAGAGNLISDSAKSHPLSLEMASLPGRIPANWDSSDSTYTR